MTPAVLTAAAIGIAACTGEREPVPLDLSTVSPIPTGPTATATDDLEFPPVPPGDDVDPMPTGPPSPLENGNDPAPDDVPPPDSDPTLGLGPTSGGQVPDPAPSVTRPASTARPTPTVQPTTRPEPSRTPTTKPTPTPTRTPTPTPDGNTSVGVLTRTDPVPAGVAEQLPYTAAAPISRCNDTAGAFTVRVDLGARPTLTAPGIAPLCLYRFDPTVPITVTVLDPGGQVKDTYRLEPGTDLQAPGDRAVVAFRRVVGDAPGTYGIVAVQGSSRATASVSVTGATAPQYIPYANDGDGEPLFAFSSDGALAPGARVRVALGGFPADSQVPLHIYRRPLDDQSPDDGPADYVTSVKVRVDATGGAVWTLLTSAKDPLGCYRVFSELVTRDEPTGTATEPDVAPLQFCLLPPQTSPSP